MTVPKIVTMVTSCMECPKRNGDTCRMVDTAIPDKKQVAPFCPLPDHPAPVIAGLLFSLEGAREPHKWGFGYALVNHVAAKLKLCLNPTGMTSVTIPYKDGGEDRTVCLAFDRVRFPEEWSSTISFIDQGREYHLNIDAVPPLLRIKSETGENLWRSLNLAV